MQTVLPELFGLSKSCNSFSASWSSLFTQDHDNRTHFTLIPISNEPSLVVWELCRRLCCPLPPSSGERWAIFLACFLLSCVLCPIRSGEKKLPLRPFHGWAKKQKVACKIEKTEKWPALSKAISQTLFVPLGAPLDSLSLLFLRSS